MTLGELAVRAMKVLARTGESGMTLRRDVRELAVLVADLAEKLAKAETRELARAEIRPRPTYRSEEDDR